MANSATTEKSLPSPSAKKQIATAGQYLSFMLGEEIYALGILNIKEIIGYEKLTEVPMMPDFVRGVINLRGDVVPVIDLKTRFGKGHTEIARRTSIIIAETQGGEENHQEIGIIVDAVNEVIDIHQDDIVLPPGFGCHTCPEFIIGMAKTDNRFIILLNISRILSLDELTHLSKVTANIIE